MSRHSRIDALTEAGVFADIDRAFARLMSDFGAEDDVALAAAATSAVHRDGHTCLNLRDAGRSIVALVGEPESGGTAEKLTPELQAISLPRRDALLAALTRSPVVAGGEARDEDRPLVLDRNAGGPRDGSPHVDRDEDRPLVLDLDRLYLHRLFEAECRLAERLLALARMAPHAGTAAADAGAAGAVDATGNAAIDAAIARMFDDREDRTDEAVAALRTALERRLCIVTGGPGTGKTTLAAKLIAVLVATGAAHPRRIGLAAPTGKAASRIQESVRAKLGDRPLNRVDGLNEFSDEAWTIHRLLMARTSRLQRLDALVVDECSMADLPLMVRLVTALPAECRLILLGDASQLSSVEPGSVFSDLCRAGERGPLSACVTTLRKNYRFQADSGIGRLASAVVAGNVDDVISLLEDEREGETDLRPLHDEAAFDEFARECATEWNEHMAALEADPRGTPPFPARRVLCSHRRGPFGTNRFNRLVKRRLTELGRRTERDDYYVGRPIIVSRNDRQTNLSNGDSGVVLPTDSGRPQVWFPDLDRDGERYLISPSRLPQHESFFALTVHRAQGSEYEEVVFIPGDAESRVNARELFYTAVTRARRKVLVMASRAAVRAAVMRATSRATGLLERLR